MSKKVKDWKDNPRVAELLAEQAAWLRFLALHAGCRHDVGYCTLLDLDRDKRA